MASTIDNSYPVTSLHSLVCFMYRLNYSNFVAILSDLLFPHCWRELLSSCVKSSLSLFVAHLSILIDIRLVYSQLTPSSLSMEGIHTQTKTRSRTIMTSTIDSTRLVTPLHHSFALRVCSYRLPLLIEQIFLSLNFKLYANIFFHHYETKLHPFIYLLIDIETISISSTRKCRL